MWLSYCNKFWLEFLKKTSKVISINSFYQDQGSAHAQKKSVPGYAWLHTNVTEVGSRLRTVTQKRNQGRFPVTHGYAKT